MPSYDIYIHSDTTEQATPTKAKKEKDAETKANETIGDITKTINAIGNPDSIISQGVGMVAKMFPAVAVASAVIGLTNKVVSTTNSFVSNATGDYRFSHDLANFNATTKAIFTPVSSGIEVARQMQQIRINNERLAQYRELTGDAIINSYGKGV